MFFCTVILTELSMFCVRLSHFIIKFDLIWLNTDYRECRLRAGLMLGSLPPWHCLHPEIFILFILVIAASTSDFSRSGVGVSRIWVVEISSSTYWSGVEHGLYNSRKCSNHLFFTSSLSVSNFPCLSLITRTLDACFPVIFLTPSNTALLIFCLCDLSTSRHMFCKLYASVCFASSRNLSTKKVVVLYCLATVTLSLL